MVCVQGDIVEVVVAFAVAIGDAVGVRGGRGGAVADPDPALAAVQGEHAALRPDSPGKIFHEFIV